MGGTQRVGQQLDHAVAFKPRSRYCGLSGGQGEDMDGFVVMSCHSPVCMNNSYF